MKEYNIYQEGLNITIKYENNDDLIGKLDAIICDLITYGYDMFYRTDKILELIQNNSMYGDDFIVTQDKDIDI